MRHSSVALWRFSVRKNGGDPLGGERPPLAALSLSLGYEHRCRCSLEGKTTRSYFSGFFFFFKVHDYKKLSPYQFARFLSLFFFFLSLFLSFFPGHYIRYHSAIKETMLYSTTQPYWRQSIINLYLTRIFFFKYLSQLNILLCELVVQFLFLTIILLFFSYKEVKFKHYTIVKQTKIKYIFRFFWYEQKCKVQHLIELHCNTNSQSKDTRCQIEVAKTFQS